MFIEHLAARLMNRAYGCTNLPIVVRLNVLTQEINQASFTLQQTQKLHGSISRRPWWRRWRSRFLYFWLNWGQLFLLSRLSARHQPRQNEKQQQSDNEWRANKIVSIVDT